MRILDRYIHKSIFTIFCSAIFIFGFLYLLIDITSQLDEFIDRKVPIPILIQYYSAFFPVILVQTSSIACLIATLFTFSTLNNNNEIIAMRSSGLNFWRIAKPALYFSLLISAMVFYLNERSIPQATQVTNQIRNQYMILEVDRLKKKKETIQNLTFYGLKNRLYFIDSFNSQTNELQGITIVEYDQGQNISQKIVALRGVWTEVTWKFYQCQVTSFDPNTLTTPVKIKIYEEKLMDIKETPEDFLRQRLNVSAMDVRELKNYIHRFANSGASKALNNLRVDFHHKITSPLRNFVIVFTGLPFVLMLKNRKGMTFTSIGIAIMVGFLYYVVEAVSLAFGKEGLLTPLFSAWLTPLLFSGIALAFIKSKF